MGKPVCILRPSLTTRIGGGFLIRARPTAVVPDVVPAGTAPTASGTTPGGAAARPHHSSPAATRHAQK